MKLGSAPVTEESTSCGKFERSAADLQTVRASLGTNLNEFYGSHVASRPCSSDLGGRERVGADVDRGTQSGIRYDEGGYGHCAEVLESA